MLIYKLLGQCLAQYGVTSYYRLQQSSSSIQPHWVKLTSKTFYGNEVQRRTPVQMPLSHVNLPSPPPSSLSSYRLGQLPSPHLLQFSLNWSHPFQSHGHWAYICWESRRIFESKIRIIAWGCIAKMIISMIMMITIIMIIIITMIRIIAWGCIASDHLQSQNTPQFHHELEAQRVLKFLKRKS